MHYLRVRHFLLRLELRGRLLLFLGDLEASGCFDLVNLNNKNYVHA